MRRSVATARFVALVALVALGLAACAEGPRATGADEIPHDASSGGQTREEAEAALGAIPGIALRELSGGERPNLKGNTGYSVTLELDPSHVIVDGAELVTFVAETVWSIREGWMPNTDIGIWMVAGPDTDVDITAAAHEAGWTERTRSTQSEPGSEGNPDGVTGVSLWVRPDDDDRTDTRNRQRLGDWPGEVPPIPEGVTAAAPR